MNNVFDRGSLCYEQNRCAQGSVAYLQAGYIDIIDYFSKAKFLLSLIKLVTLTRDAMCGTPYPRYVNHVCESVRSIVVSYMQSYLHSYHFTFVYFQPFKRKVLSESQSESTHPLVVIGDSEPEGDDGEVWKREEKTSVSKVLTSSGASTSTGSKRQCFFLSRK